MLSMSTCYTHLLDVLQRTYLAEYPDTNTRLQTLEAQWQGPAAFYKKEENNTKQGKEKDIEWNELHICLPLKKKKKRHYCLKFTA